MLLTILTSAGIAGLIGFLGLLLNGWRERKARRDELLLQKAVAFSVALQRTTIEMAEKSNRVAIIGDSAINVEFYFRELKRLLEKGEYSREFHNVIESYKRKVGLG